MTIHVVGLGLDPDNLPDHSASVVDHAQVLAGGNRQLAFFEDHPARKIPLTSPLDQALNDIAEAHADGSMVVVVADGDPLFYGIGARLIDLMGPEDVRIYPNVTTLQVAAARLRVPWQDFQTVSLHGRSDYLPLFSALRFSRWVAVFTDDANIPSAIAQTILDKGGEKFAMWVLENLETENERFGKYTLAEAGRKSFSHNNLVILEKRAEPEVPLGLGTPDDAFRHEEGLITKGPVRAAGIAALRPTKESDVWDLGAGCGAVAIETSSLTRGSVFAVEKNAGRVGMIRENILHTGAYNVEVVHGTMPECLADLPDPDRIFLGGGMGRGGDVLAEACERLRPGGRIVAHTVLLDSLLRTRQIFDSMGWPYFVTLVQAAESVELAGDLRMQGLNPVFIIGADKPEK